jgi:predicted  nucleic acid-binding Zn-ribbon protein
MKQECSECGRLVEVGESQIPDGALCPECSRRKGRYFFPDDPKGYGLLTWPSDKERADLIPDGDGQ